MRNSLPQLDDEPTNPGTQIPRARVLIAEDDVSLRAMIAAQLRRDGFEVFEVDSGDQALAMMETIHQHRWPCDDLELVVMDVRMPGTSGLEAAYMLRAARWTTPVLLITAFPDPELLEETERLGVSLLAKPFAFEQLTDTAIATIMCGSSDRAPQEGKRS